MNRGFLLLLIAAPVGPAGNHFRLRGQTAGVKGRISRRRHQAVAFGHVYLTKVSNPANQAPFWVRAS
jgi:hypothetical protein